MSVLYTSSVVCFELDEECAQVGVLVVDVRPNTARVLCVVVKDDLSFFAFAIIYVVIACAAELDGCATFQSP